MTEEEAKTKWCPFTRVVGFTTQGGSRSQGFSANRDLLGAPLGRCIGSGCMAWRWTGEGQKPRIGETDTALSILGDEEQKREALERIAARELATRPGYCGLAGAPTPNQAPVSVGDVRP